MYILSRVSFSHEFYLNCRHYLTWYVLLCFVLLSHTSVSRKLSIRQKIKYAFRIARLCRRKAKRAQKMRKDIRSDTHKRQNQTEAKKVPRLALQSNENERSEITRERKTKKSTPTKDYHLGATDLFKSIYDLNLQSFFWQRE